MDETVNGQDERRIVALAGGVGGAKLASGLALTGLGERLSVVVNTADDFQLFGLHISPDVDTVTYTLAGLANREMGWGVSGDTFVTLGMLERYGQDIWFQLGDKDFATHILRTMGLRSGKRLTTVTAELTGALDIEAQILPMTDDTVATRLLTESGKLEFQEYFVRRRHADRVLGVEFAGIDQATVPREVGAALETCSGVIICPSNPIVSIDPILSVGDMWERIAALNVPVVAVSPIVGGQAIKGPAAEMLESLGHESSALGVAEIYRGLIDGMVIDNQDEELAGAIEKLGMRVLVTNTIMTDDASRRQLGETALALCSTIASEGSS